MEGCFYTAWVDLSRSLGVEGLVISISRLVTMRVFADRLVGCRHQSHKWEFCPRKQLSSKKNFFLSVNCLTLLDRFLNNAA
jgi:hypothetical protein